MLDNQSRFTARARRLAAGISSWFDRIDPGTHRRIKGLRLVTAFGLAGMLSTVPEIAMGHGRTLGYLAAGSALWARVSEAQTTRCESARDLSLLCLAAGGGAASAAVLASYLEAGWAELALVSGSFCVGYFGRFGVLGAGIGSQIFIGQHLAYTAGATTADLPTVTLATLLAILASVVPRTLSGPSEQPVLAVPTPPPDGSRVFTEIVMGLQAATASFAIVLLSRELGLTQSTWAITACTYVVANSTAGTIDRVRRWIRPLRKCSRIDEHRHHDGRTPVHRAVHRQFWAQLSSKSLLQPKSRSIYFRRSKLPCARKSVAGANVDPGKAEFAACRSAKAQRVFLRTR